MRLLSVLVVLLPVLAGCAEQSTVEPPAELELQGSELNVVTAFYPLTYATQMVAGDLLLVEPLMEPDAQPEDVTLGSREEILVDEADVVVSLSEFHGGLDELTANRDNVLDVASAARLLPRASLPSVSVPASEASKDGLDPHFWLDPTRLADVGGLIAARLADLDPDNASAYEANAEALQSKLRALDSDYRLDLTGCESKNIVTSQAAFGYLAQRYGFTQVAVDPAADTAPVAEYVAANDVSTIYTPPAAAPARVTALTEQVQVTAGKLDPLTSVPAQSAGGGYEDTMRVNLEVLGEGQRCTSLGVPQDPVDAEELTGSP